MANKSKWTNWHSFGLLVITIVTILLGLLLSYQKRLLTWILVMLLFTLFAIVAGHGLTGRFRGLLIDEQNRMSLSRFQMVLWTTMVLSGFFIMALSNIAAGQESPLSIAIPSEIWILMGISTTSLVASPLIKSTKESKTANDNEKERTFKLMAKQMRISKDEVEKKIENRGQIVANRNIEDARFSDLFSGEEVRDAAHLDLGRVQMFFFTVVIVVAYAAAIGTVLSSDAIKIEAFPDLQQGMVALLGISHAGYLTKKAIPRPESEKPE